MFYKNKIVDFFDVFVVPWNFNDFDFNESF